MSIRSLDRIFKPQRIALVGVTANPKSVGGKVLANLIGGGFRGVVYPVNPSYEAVLGIPCFPDLASLPKTPDLAILCGAAEQTPELVRSCGEAGILGVIIISAGFKESGPEGKALEARLLEEKRRFDGMRIVGPNCLGVIVPSLGLNASFAGATPKKGHIAFISQSGALCTSVLDWAMEENIGFSSFVSIGNTLDVDFGDLIDYFGEDEGTKAIILYMESLSDARKFTTAARAFARTKPILVYKAGRFAESAKVAASHTGAMASEDAVYDAAFGRIGVARVFDIGEIFDCADLLGRQRIPKGPRLGVVTNAGGPGVMAADALIAAGGCLAELSEDSLARLSQDLPPMWSHGNPVDVLGDARSKRILKAAGIVLEDPGVDALLVILTPQAMTDPSAIARSLSTLREGSSKPILAAWLGGRSMRDGIAILNEAGIATYATPEQAVRAFMTLVDYSRNLEALYETPKDVPVQFPVDRGRVKQRLLEMARAEGPTLPEDLSKELLEAYGIPVTRTRRAADASEAVRLAKGLGFPVALKLLSPDITHKSDVGGVVLGIQDARGVSAAFESLLSGARAKQPEARLLGVTVQPMAETSGCVEMILGAKRDPVFGAVILVGAGGITAELLADRALEFPPLNERLARRMLESLKTWPLLTGYRGRPKADTDKLVETLMRLSYLVADHPEIEELDVNPLLVGPHGVTALDARVMVGEALSSKPYSHLVLRPYPEEYVRTAHLPDGSSVILRPIKPEDEPRWLELLGGCSRETIYMRFRYFFHWESHEVASRYCFIDYDREMAIVAESEGQLLGVGRLVADPDHETAEYAVLVADAWQNRSLGSALTDYCMEIARSWGVRRVVAQTTSDNPRMVAVFRKRGFRMEMDPQSSLVEVSKELA
ncbi:MAG: bifunctional acetate--CoA ligase family protein/GNAT family N-acetyltransferase [Elusimicrobiota bacterium]